MAGLAAGLAVTVLAGAGSAATPSAAAKRSVVVGTDGYLFSAQDWRVPCQDAGAPSEQAAQALVDLGAALQASGRETTVLLGPDKSTTMVDDLPAVVPDRACHAAQDTQFWTKAGTSPQFLDLRQPLRAASRTKQVYYRKDTHFAHDGDTVYAKELAKRLDPTLALGFGTQVSSGQVKGDLASVLGVPPYETVAGTGIRNLGVTVRELPQQDIGLIVPRRTFTATPSLGGHVLPGRTVFVGDSFTAVALYQLAQLSQETVFVWTDSSAPLQPMLDELAKGDRVVIEVVERFATRYRMFRPDVVEGARRLPQRSAVAPVLSGLLPH